MRFHGFLGLWIGGGRFLCALPAGHRSIALTGAYGRCPSFFLFGLTPNKGKVAVFLKESRLKNFYARCARPLYSFSCSPALSPASGKAPRAGRFFLYRLGFCSIPSSYSWTRSSRWPFFRFMAWTPWVFLVALGAMSPVWNSSIRPEEAVSSTSQSSRTYRATVKGDLSL